MGAQMSQGDALLTLVIVLALANAFFAGFHGAAAVVSTAISSRALRPRQALVGSALAAMAGPLALGTAVANLLVRAGVGRRAEPPWLVIKLKPERKADT